MFLCPQQNYLLIKAKKFCIFYITLGLYLNISLLSQNYLLIKAKRCCIMHKQRKEHIRAHARIIYKCIIGVFLGRPCLPLERGGTRSVT